MVSCNAYLQIKALLRFESVNKEICFISRPGDGLSCCCFQSEISEGETSGDDFSDGDLTDIDDFLTTPSGSNRETSGTTLASDQVNIHNS
jgi:hypothetical protein